MTSISCSIACSLQASNSCTTKSTRLIPPVSVTLYKRSFPSLIDITKQNLTKLNRTLTEQGDFVRAILFFVKSILHFA